MMKKTFTKLVSLNIILVMLLNMLIPTVSALELFPEDDPGIIKAEDGAGYYKITVDGKMHFDLYSLYTVELMLASFDPMATRTNYFDNDLMEPVKEGVENGRRYAIYKLEDASEVVTLPYSSNEIMSDFKNDMNNRYSGADKSFWSFTIRESYTGLNYRFTEDVYRIEKVSMAEAIANPFIDVKEGIFYFEPVLWAVSAGITNGTTATTFSPNKSCTRAEVVTFLWRAKGSPEPQSSVNPFVDVTTGSYYHKAVLWAVEQGITNGTGDGTTFSPDMECTRAQVATFLWRTVGKPDVGNKTHPFRDIEAGSYYYDAVLWAVEAGVTNGTGDGTTFSPNKSCSRSEIVTFLYRALK